jgi:hypothetical protein
MRGKGVIGVNRSDLLVDVFWAIVVLLIMAVIGAIAFFGGGIF